MKCVILHKSDELYKDVRYQLSKQPRSVLRRKKSPEKARGVAALIQRGEKLTSKQQVPEPRPVAEVPWILQVLGGGRTGKVVSRLGEMGLPKAAARKAARKVVTSGKPSLFGRAKLAIKRKKRGREIKKRTQEYMETGPKTYTTRPAAEREAVHHIDEERRVWADIKEMQKIGEVRKPTIAERGKKLLERIPAKRKTFVHKQAETSAEKIREMRLPHAEKYSPREARRVKRAVGNVFERTPSKGPSPVFKRTQAVVKKIYSGAGKAKEGIKLGIRGVRRAAQSVASQTKQAVGHLRTAVRGKQPSPTDVTQVVGAAPQRKIVSAVQPKTKARLGSEARKLMPAPGDTQVTQLPVEAAKKPVRGLAQFGTRVGPAPTKRPMVGKRSGLTYVRSFPLKKQ